MATVSDITTTPLSGLNHIDALLDKGPDWNYLSNSNANVLYYTFSVTSGNEAGKTGQEAFSAAQQAATRGAFTYLQQVTGIEFRETTSGTGAQIHLANMDLDGAFTTGLCSWQASYRHTANNTLTEYSASAYVYLDNANYRAANQNLTPGGQGYETLLHELGHALGLKHPFYENTGEPQIVLPTAEDNTSYTIMSYTQSGPHSSTYSPYDIAALNWLYGRDGLRGEYGINSTSGGRYITGSDKSETLMGTQFNDILQGNGGDDMIDGGAGTDTVIYKNNRDAYTFANLADGALRVASATEGVDTLRNIEFLSFADMTVARASLTDTTPPPAPTMAVTKNGALYARGDRPNMNGSAEPHATIKVYIGDRVIATAQADANGLWSTQASVALADGLNYHAYAVAIDAAGNVSKASEDSVFHVDATAPSVPTMSVALASGGNQPLFSGTGESGTTIELYRNSDGIKFGAVEVGSDGWILKSAPLPNGVYDVIGASVDVAGNATAMRQNLSITINNADNQVGTAGADKFVMGPANIAVDGGAGIDTVVFGGNRADYTVAKGSWGYAVSDARGGIDGLYNVERIQFNDSWLAIDEPSAQVFRLYQAAFGRPSDEWGMGYWIDRVEKGASLLTIATEFTVGQAEFDKIYGVDPSDEVFITNLYQNVLKRAPDDDGFAYWLTRVDNSSKGQILMEFSESPENQALVVGATSTGIEFTPWVEGSTQPVAVGIVGSASADLAAGALLA